MAGGSSADSKNKRSLANLPVDHNDVPPAMSGRSQDVDADANAPNPLGQVMLMMSELNDRMAAMEAQRMEAAQPAGYSGRKRTLHEISDDESEGENDSQDEEDENEDPLLNLGKCCLATLILDCLPILAPVEICHMLRPRDLASPRDMTSQWPWLQFL